MPEGSLIREELDALRIDRSRAEARGGRWIKVALFAVLAAAAAGAALFWLVRDRGPTVRTVAVRERSGGAGAATVLNATGYVTARRRATVSSKTTGKLLEVNVEEGMIVREGQVLARLDAAQEQALLDLAAARVAAARSALAETRVDLAQARRTLERTRNLVAEGVMGQADLDAAAAVADGLAARLELAQDNVRVAEREVALNRTVLADMVVRAPFDGVVISKDAQPGEMVSPVSAGGGFTRTGICTIVDMSSLEIEVEVNESFISRVVPEQPVEAVLDAYPDWRIPARVITTIPTADRQKATVLVRIAFDALDPRILPDMGVKVAFRGAAAAAEGAPVSRASLEVPRAALRRDGDRDVVLVVRDGKIERRAIGLGARSGEDVEVISGLNPGEQVIVEGPADLSEGDKVIVK